MMLILFGQSYFIDNYYNSQDAALVVVSVEKQTAMQQAQNVKDNIAKQEESANSIKQLGFLENLIKTQKDVKKMMKSVKDNIGVIKDFQSYKKIYTLIESMACMTKEYTLYASISSDNDDCFLRFNQELAIANMNLSNDLVLGIGVVGAMSQESRVSGLEMIIEKLEKASEIMNKLNVKVKMDLKKQFLEAQRTTFIKESDYMSSEIECSMN
jgi:hypothetical protein